MSKLELIAELEYEYNRIDSIIDKIYKEGYTDGGMELRGLKIKRNNCLKKIENIKNGLPFNGLPEYIETICIGLK